jgi:hypothetical protein
MKFLPIILLLIFPIPSYAITWKEFWEPFTSDTPHYHRHYSPLCRERVYYEEYIPGNRWRPGYVRTWSEIIIVPCDEY